MLVVDDDRHVRDQIVRVLSRAGAVVCARRSTGDALAFAEATNLGIDVLVSDLSVPDLGGPGLAERLRSRCPGLAVVMASGLPDATAACERVGAVFVRKPFGSHDLLGALDQALRR